jgi:transmembrane sensor
MSTESGPPPDQVDWEALARYFAGESSATEAEATSRWLAEHPEEADAFAALDAVTAQLDSNDLADAVGGEPDVDAAWQRVSAQLDERPVAAKTKVYTFAPRPSVWRSPALRAAAAIALIAGSAAVWRLDMGESPDAAVTAARTFATAPGKRDSVVLVDGSRVLLGPGSSLRIEAGYGDQRRDVYLDGEALFDVRHDDARPFVVHASDLMVHDLGTTFTVRTTNGTNGVTTVAVTQGAVRVARSIASTDSGVVLRAGDRGTTASGSAFTVERGAVLTDELAFTRGQLVFRDTPLPVVAASLRRWYGVDVRIADSSLNARTLTASFNEEPLADVLRVIGLALDARVQHEDSTVVIGRAPPSPNQRR